MEKETVLYQRVIQLHKEMRDYTNLVTEQSKAKQKELEEKILKEFKDNPGSEEIENLSFDVYVKRALHTTDVTKLQTKFVDFFDAFTLLSSGLDFEKELLEDYNAIKGIQQKQYFTIEKGDFEEVVSGTIDTMKENFKKNNTFEKIKEEFERYLKK